MSSGQQITGNINSFNVLTNHHHGNVVNFITEAGAERQQILQWLSPLEPQQRHQGVRAERLKGVGNWVLETNEFRKWRDAEDGCVETVLFCSGNPGVGKTFLSSLVIDSLCDQVGGEDIAVVGLYCDFLAQQKQSTASMLGAILKQLVTRGEIPEHIREAFQKAKKEFGGRSLLPPDQVEILEKAITSLPRVYICIDALDESTPKHRRELLESLQEIVRVSPNTRIFLTGRPHIDDEIVKCFTRAIRIPISPTRDDVKSYLEMRLSDDTDPNAMDDELRADIMRVIPEKISEIFLLVSLNIDAILGEITLHQRRRKLDEMTKGEGLSDAYAATLSRVKAQQRSRSILGMNVLMWVSHSERPLHVDELCHALGVEEGSIDLNIRNIPAIETLLACSMGLVTVEKSSSTVRPIHYTLQEYLSNNSNLFLKPHSTIAQACLTYLNFKQVRGISPTLRSVPPTIPFANYASCHWGTHARQEMTESVKILALKLLDKYDQHISSKMLILRWVDLWDRPLDHDEIARGFTGLHGAAFLGCVEITVALLDMHKWDVREVDFHGNTAIAWAARRGHEGVVRTLLDQKDINPNIADTQYGRTPLSWAAGNGHEGVVRTLLERSDINPNDVDNWSRTPLSWAAWSGHETVVRLLLERKDVSPDTADTRFGQTPLSWAAGNGQEGVVRILLERSDINPDKGDNRSRTPLSWAAKNGHEEVVRILLEQNDVNPSTVDALCGRTSLSWAAENGHEGVVRTLLERNDINPDKADHSSRTPLLWAAKNGHEGVVGILLERKDVSPNTPDTLSGQTPLLYAAGNGHEGVVKMLLERSDINPDKADKRSRTPLSWAAKNGHERVVRILLERKDVNPNAAEIHSCRTPLSWAAENGHKGVVRILLEQNNVDPNTADTRSGRTPLSWAAKNGCEGVVRILLERNDVNCNTADTLYGETPLSWAAENGHKEVVRMLLERNDVNPNTANTRSGRTPLLCAARNGHEGVVRILLDRNDVNPNAVDPYYGRTPFSWAAGNGHEGVMRILLERKDVSPDSPDTRFGQTPLSWAAGNGQERAVTILLKRSDINPDRGDNKSRTPLSWAAGNGHEGVVRILLEQNDVNPNTADTQSGGTPLSWAAENGHKGVVKILLDRNDVNPNTVDTLCGRTPLSWAAGNGHEEVVRILLERNDDIVDTYHGRTPLQWAVANGYARIAKLLPEQTDSITDMQKTCD